VFSAGPLFLLLKSWTVANGEVLYPPQPNLAFAWDAVYGQGFFVAKILGKKFGQGTRAACSI